MRTLPTKLFTFVHNFCCSKYMMDVTEILDFVVTPYSILIESPYLSKKKYLNKIVVETRRIELLTPCVQGRCSPS